MTKEFVVFFAPALFTRSRLAQHKIYERNCFQLIKSDFIVK